MAVGGKHSFVFLGWAAHWAKYSLSSCVSSLVFPAISMVHLLSPQASMSSSPCQCSHPLVPHHSDVLYVLPSYFQLTQSWNLCYLNSSLPDFQGFRSGLSSPLQDSASHDGNQEEGLPPQARSWLCSQSQHRHTCARVRGFSLLAFLVLECNPQEAGVGSGGDMRGWLLAVTEFPPVVYNRWQLGNSVSYKTGWSCLTLKLWSRNSSWGLSKHNKLYI